MAVDPSLAAVSMALRRGAELLDADPLSYWRHASPRHRFCTENLGLAELYIHSSNKWGKTHWGAHVGVALAQGRRSLDGVELPRLPSPNIGLVLSLDYKQQIDSVQKAYLAAIGTWPHKAEWDGEILKSVRVKQEHSLSDDPRAWSVIRFQSQENRRTGVGARCHWVHADEPPIMDIWREVRKASEPGWPFPRFITATPLKRSQWQPLRADYPADHEGRIHHPVLESGKRAATGFLRVRGDLEDVRIVPGREGGILSAADIEMLHALYLTDPKRRARLSGEEIDDSGASPWAAQYEELTAWLSRCLTPEVEEWKVSREVMSEAGKKLVTERVDVEVWEEAVPGHVYRVVLDPSLGIDDEKHDPCEALVWDMTDRVQVALYSGYIGEYGLGVLGAGMSKAYNSALVDPAVTGGYGSACLTGLRAAGCSRVVSRKRIIPATGLERTDIGFTEGADTRMEHMGAIREALVWSAAGEPWLTLRSARQVAELMDLVVDEKDRPVTEPGKHDEALTTVGRIASLTRPSAAAPKTKPVQSRESTREVGMRAARQAIGLPGRREKSRNRPASIRRSR